jgi:hypothetical protein
MSKIIKCEHCGVEFEAKLITAKYCSSKCKDTYRRHKKRNKNYPDKKCDFCEKMFKPKRLDSKLCSRKCMVKEWREANPEKVAISKKKAREKNKEKYEAVNQRWREANPEKVKAYSKKWRDENPETARAKVRGSYYRKEGYPEELLEIKELQYQIKKEIKNQSKG